MKFLFKFVFIGLFIELILRLFDIVWKSLLIKPKSGLIVLDSGFLSSITRLNSIFVFDSDENIKILSTNPLRDKKKSYFV